MLNTLRNATLIALATTAVIPAMAKAQTPLDMVANCAVKTSHALFNQPQQNIWQQLCIQETVETIYNPHQPVQPNL